MELLLELGSWISQNEALLSGLAAMIVVGGVCLSVLSLGLGRFRRGAPETRSEPADAPAPAAPMTLKQLTAPSSHETRFAQSGGVRIAYNDRGEGPCEFVFTPGIVSHLNITDNLPTSRGTYDALERIARVLVFDKRGQGLSDPTISSPSLEERADDIVAVMDDAGMERAFVFGVSEGGPMCLYFAHTHPERVLGLVLLGTTARFVQSDDFPIGIPAQALKSLPRAWGTGVLRDVFFPSLSREQIDDPTYCAFEKLVASRADIQQIVDMMIATDVRALLPEIETPALVLHHAGDLAVPVRLGRYVADHLPNAEFMEISGVDHADLSQTPEAIERIRAFCERVSASR